MLTTVCRAVEDIIEEAVLTATEQLFCPLVPQTYVDALHHCDNNVIRFEVRVHACEPIIPNKDIDASSFVIAYARNDRSAMILAVRRAIETPREGICMTLEGITVRPSVYVYTDAEETGYLNIAVLFDLCVSITDTQ